MGAIDPQAAMAGPILGKYFLKFAKISETFENLSKFEANSQALSKNWLNFAKDMQIETIEIHQIYQNLLKIYQKVKMVH